MVVSSSGVCELSNLFALHAHGGCQSISYLFSVLNKNETRTRQYDSTHLVALSFMTRSGMEGQCWVDFFFSGSVIVFLVSSTGFCLCS